jgi:hypothetical protein
LVRIALSSEFVPFAEKAIREHGAAVASIVALTDTNEE